MVKICFVVPGAYYLFNPRIKDYANKIGGSQKQAYLLSTELANNQRFDVNFCVADFGQPEFELVHNVKIWKSFNFKENLFTRFFKLYRTLNMIDAAFYIFRASDIGVAVFTFILRFLLGKKVVYMLGADIELNFKEHRRLLGFLTAFSMIFTYKFANKIAVQSQHQFDLFTKKYHRRPNLLMMNIIEPGVSENAGIKENILWIGRIDKIKNPALFIKLAEKYPAEKFVMIAPITLDNPEFGKMIHAQATKLHNLKLIDFVDPYEIGDYYKKAKIYVVTSESEGFSNSMLEALADKCPVLSFKVNNDNILTNFNLGFCAKGDLDQFYSLFDKMLPNCILLKELGENALNYVINNHKKEVAVNGFISLLD